MKQYDLAGERYAMVFKYGKKFAAEKKLLEHLKSNIEKTEAELNALSKNGDWKKEISAYAAHKNLVITFLQHKYNLGLAFFRMENRVNAEPIFNEIIDIDSKLKLNSYEAFMSNKRRKEMTEKTPEVMYDPRL
jgi:tetratricopeptide (TPR) repeat protein